MKLSVFIGIIYICNIVNGAAITVADCGDPVAEGDPQVLNCHITGSIVNGISWFREGDTNRIIFCVSKICLSTDALYNVSPTPHLDNKQQFTIISVRAEDFTKKWICVDGSTYPDPITESSTCFMKKPTPVETTTVGSSNRGWFIHRGVAIVIDGIWYRK